MANIKVNIDVESGDVQIASDKVLTLQQQIKVLRQELQKTPEGTREFNLLVGKLNDTQDAFSRVNIKGKELFGTLGLIPGPIGEIAARTNSAIDAIKIFGSFKASDIKAQFVALGADIKDVATTIFKLTGITAAYNLVARGTAAALNAVGIAANTASLGVKAFSAAVVASGVGIVIVGVGILIEKLMSLGTAADQTRKKYEDLDRAMQRSNDHMDKRADAAFEMTKEQLKREGKSKEELLKLENKFLEGKIAISKQDDKNAEAKRIRDLVLAKDDEARKKIQEDFDIALIKRQEERNSFRVQIEKNLTTAYDSEQQKREERNTKAQQKLEQDAAKTKAQRDKELEEITKNAEAAQMTVLEGRTKELAEVNKKYGEQIALAKKYGKDTTGLEEARRVERKRINAKYDEDEYKTALEFAKKLADITVASIQNDLEQSKAAREEKYKDDLRALEADKEFIKMSEDAKNVYRQQLRQAADQDITELEDKASQEVFDRRLKALQVQNEGLVKGTQSYFDTKREIINVSEQNELNDLRIALNQKNITTEEFEKQRANIIAKYAQQRKDIGLEELNTYLGYASSVLGAINNVFSMASSNLKMQQDQDVANAEGNAEKIDAIKRKGFEDNKKIQIAQAIIGTLQSAVQSFQSLSVIPIVGPALGAAAAAAALVFGYKQVALIKAQQYKSDSSSGGASSSSTSSVSAPAFSTPTVGAPQIGPTGAQEGTIAGIVAGSLAANNSQSRPIRAYVVGNDITSEQQLQRRIRTSARLGG